MTLSSIAIWIPNVFLHDSNKHDYTSLEVGISLRRGIRVIPRI